MKILEYRRSLSDFVCYVISIFGHDNHEGLHHWEIPGKILTGLFLPLWRPNFFNSVLGVQIPVSKTLSLRLLKRLSIRHLRKIR